MNGYLLENHEARYGRGKDASRGKQRLGTQEGPGETPTARCATYPSATHSWGAPAAEGVVDKDRKPSMNDMMAESITHPRRSLSISADPVQWGQTLCRNKTAEDLLVTLVAPRPP